LGRQCGDECADGCFVGGISVGAAACCCEFFQLFADGFVGVEANDINGDIAVALVNPDFESSDLDQAVATALAACSDRKGFLTCFTILCLR